MAKKKTALERTASEAKETGKEIKKAVKRELEKQQARATKLAAKAKKKAEKEARKAQAAAEKLKRKADKKLRSLGKDVEFHIYPGTEHGFFNDTRPEVHKPDASNQTWERTIAFYRKHLG